MKYSIIAMLCLALFHVDSVMSQVYEKSRKESKTFKVYPETMLEVSNKYGNIHLFSWDNDSVKINIQVDVKANKESKAEKIFEYIDFEFSDTRFYIIAKTQLKQNQGSFWSEVSDLANTIFSGSNKVKINYDVYVPREMEIKIENKFGNIYFSDYSGKTTINLSNGDLKVNNLSGSSDIEVGFGNASIGSLKGGKLSIRYAELDLAQADEIEIDSKSSTLNISKVNVLNINSRRDKLNVDDINTLKGSTYFSYVNVKKLAKGLNLNTEYGEIKIEGMHQAFKTIELQSKYTDVFVDVPSSISCNFNVNHNETTEISYPDHYKNIQSAEINKKEDKYRTWGVLGEELDPKGNIEIDMVSGKIVVRDTVQIF